MTARPITIPRLRIARRTALALALAACLPVAARAQDDAPAEAPVAKPVELVDDDGNFAPPPAADETETIVRLQIYLDEHMFGPGKIDGALGEFGKKAASVYNQIHGVPVGNYHRLLEASRKYVANLYTTYTVREEDKKFVTPDLPTSPAQQAKRKYMGYRSLAEMVAERFHTSEKFLESINPGLNVYNLKPGTTLKVPNVTPFEIEALPVHRKFDTEEPMSSRAVVVDVRARVAIFFDEQNKPIASFPITPGQPKFIRFGEWKITNVVTTPEFRWDKQMLEAGTRSDDYYQIPIGPNSPVGIVWCGTSRSGVGLHGTSTPHAIGRGESAGCIRLANWDAARLPKLIRPGTRVIIR